jgi:hypothetical protein
MHARTLRCSAPAEKKRRVEVVCEPTPLSTRLLSHGHEPDSVVSILGFLDARNLAVCCAVNKNLGAFLAANGAAKRLWDLQWRQLACHRAVDIKHDRYHDDCRFLVQFGHGKARTRIPTFAEAKIPAPGESAHEYCIFIPDTMQLILPSAPRGVTRMHVEGQTSRAFIYLYRPWQCFTCGGVFIEANCFTESQKPTTHYGLYFGGPLCVKCMAQRELVPLHYGPLPQGDAYDDDAPTRATIKSSFVLGRARATGEPIVEDSYGRPCVDRKFYNRALDRDAPELNGTHSSARPCPSGYIYHLLCCDRPWGSLADAVKAPLSVFCCDPCRKWFEWTRHQVQKERDRLRRMGV